MLYEIAHFLRDKMTWLWDMVEVLNSFLFTIRYGRRLRSISGEGVIIKGLPSKFKIVPIREIPTEQLVEFLLVSQKRLIGSSNPMDLTLRA